MMSSVQECACRAVDKKGRELPLVIIADDPHIAAARAIVGVSLPPGSECSDSTWRTPEGNLVTVRRWSDDPPEFPNGFELEVCNGGQKLKSHQVDHLKRWRKHAKRV